MAQYVRTIINLLLSLYSARLVLDILGVDDYGIYSLVAGVVSMLSFLTNSLVGSTQRFLSFCQGRGELERLQAVFSNSLLLHIALGLGITLTLESLAPFLFHGFLNIPEGREEAAGHYHGLYLLYRRSLSGITGVEGEYSLHLLNRCARWGAEGVFCGIAPFYTFGQLGGLWLDHNADQPVQPIGLCDLFAP